MASDQPPGRKGVMPADERHPPPPPSLKASARVAAFATAGKAPAGKSRSPLRAGGGRGGAAAWEDLRAALDAVDAHVGGALQQRRQDNAVSLGDVRGLAHSKSWRLRVDAAAAAAAAAADEGQLIKAVHAAAPAAGTGLAAPPVQAAGARWGAMQQGGLYQLSWVAGLVQFSDFRQRQAAAAAPDKGENAEAPAFDGDTIGWLERGAGLKPGGAGPPATAGPKAAAPPKTAAGGPHGREEVAQLQAWVLHAVGLIAEGAGGERGGSADVAHAVLWVLGSAFEVLQRQVAAECGERGALLGALWQHAGNLAELRCSLVYESALSAVAAELRDARQRTAAADAAAQAAEKRATEDEKGRCRELQGEVRAMAQLLASAEEETSRAVEEAAMLRCANEAAAAQRASGEARLAEELRLRMDLQHDKSELEAVAAEQSGVVVSQRGELAQLRGDLQRSRDEALALAEDRARLEVESQRAQRGYQTSEVLALSLREQLAARQAELSDLTRRHAALQAESAAASAQLHQAQAALSALEAQHDSLQASSTEQAQQLDAALEGQTQAAADAARRAAAAAAERASLQTLQQEAAAREHAVAEQLKQLAAAHQQQAAALRQEAEARRAADDELAALRAGLQVTQQRLEGLGVVFVGGGAHRSAGEAWLATGPISMARQVVGAANQQLGELVTKRAQLLHELGAAKERWQAEEGVRVRLQEQLLEAKAREAKACKEREGLEGVVRRLEAQRVATEAELAQIRRMLWEAEMRCQASHKAGMEAANEAKRLAPLEARCTRLEGAVKAAGEELERAQHEVTVHQQAIRRLLEEKSAALEQLAGRTQALDAAALQVRELSAAAGDRLQLAEAKAKIEEELHELRHRCGATERLQSGSAHQLVVARRLLADAASADARSRLAAAEEELAATRTAASAQRRELLLLRDRQAALESQLLFMERQLQAAVHTPLSAAVAAAGGGGGGGGAASTAMVEQLRRLLETKEERIKQLERLQASLAGSASQLQAVQADLRARDGEAAALRAEVAATRRRLQALQEAQAKAATRDLVQAVACDPALPPGVAQALALDYARSHLKSELTWTRAKLAFVSQMAAQLRAKLAAAEAAREQAEMEGLCVEAFYLEQSLLDHRAFAAEHSATTFVHAKGALAGTVAALAELRRQLLAPAHADLPRLAEQVEAMAAALGACVERYSGRVDQTAQVDPLAELELWQRSMLAAMPAARPTSPPPLQHVSALIVGVYAHRMRQLPLGGPDEHEGPLVDSVYEGMAQFFCERRGFSRAAALSPTGPVAALLAGARAHLQQPKQLLLGRMAGLAPGGGDGGGTLRSLRHPRAWHFLQRVLCCLRALQGTGWDALAKEWAESEGGVVVPLPCVMDLLANVYNTDTPALLDSVRRGLVPLVRQGRRGPALDLDALLLVLLGEFGDGACPADPLSRPRRLTDGTTAAAALLGGPTSGLAGTASSVAIAVGANESYLAAALSGDRQQAQQQGQAQQQQRRHCSPMRRRIVNLVSDAEGSAGGSSPLAAGAAAAAAAAGGSRAPHVLGALRELSAANPQLPMGLRSNLRASSPTPPM